MNSLKKEDYSRAAKKVSLLLKEGIGIGEIISATNKSLSTLNRLGNDCSKK